MHYAGVRPARVRRVVSLDGFGIPHEDPAEAPRKFAEWLDALRDGQVFAPTATSTPSPTGCRRTIRGSRATARCTSRALGRRRRGRTARLNSDPRHKLPFPTVYRLEEVYAVWRAIEAPVLWVAAADSHIPGGSTTTRKARAPSTRCPVSASASRTSAAAGWS